MLAATFLARYRRLLWLGLGGWACFATARDLRGDIFVLRNGGQLRGESVNPGEAGRRQIQIQLASGITIRVSGGQISEVIRESADLATYDRIAPTFSDTAQEQWRLAEWCREHGLEKERREHLRRVVELDSDFAVAWRALGYSELNGQWTTHAEWVSERGLVYYRGRWRLPQEATLLEERRQLELRERAWFGKLNSWRDRLDTSSSADAAAYIAAISDPDALKAMAVYLRREKSPQVRMMYVAALVQIQDPRAHDLLIATVLNESDPEVFHAAVDSLVGMQLPTMSKRFAEALKDSSNARLNRAAYVLGRLGDPRMIPVLVEVLVTTHLVANPAGGRTTATLAHGPSGETSTMASSGAQPAAPPQVGVDRSPAVISRQFANPEVLQSLVKLSGGQSFGYDQRAWANWWLLARRSASNNK